jgi:hypothetical protein
VDASGGTSWSESGSFVPHSGHISPPTRNTPMHQCRRGFRGGRRRCKQRLEMSRSVNRVGFGPEDQGLVWTSDSLSNIYASEVKRTSDMLVAYSTMETLSCHHRAIATAARPPLLRTSPCRSFRFVVGGKGREGGRRRRRWCGRAG